MTLICDHELQGQPKFNQSHRIRSMIQNNSHTHDQDWELFRVFDSLEFELTELNSTAVACNSEVNLSTQAAARVASLALHYEP